MKEAKIGAIVTAVALVGMAALRMDHYIAAYVAVAGLAFVAMAYWQEWLWTQDRWDKLQCQITELREQFRLLEGKTGTDSVARSFVGGLATRVDEMGRRLNTMESNFNLAKAKKGSAS